MRRFFTASIAPALITFEYSPFQAFTTLLKKNYLSLSYISTFFPSSVIYYLFFWIPFLYWWLAFFPNQDLKKKKLLYLVYRRQTCYTVHNISQQCCSDGTEILTPFQVFKAGEIIPDVVGAVLDTFFCNCLDAERWIFRGIMRHFLKKAFCLFGVFYKSRFQILFRLASVV